MSKTEEKSIHKKQVEIEDNAKSSNPAGNAESASDDEFRYSEVFDTKPLEGEELINFIKTHSKKTEGLEIPNIKNDPKHVRIYYSLEEAANIVKDAGTITCTPADLLHYAGIGKIRLVTVIPVGVNIYIGDNYQEYVGVPLLLPDLLVLGASYCRQIECYKETEQADFNDAFLIDQNGNVHSLPPIFSYGTHRMVWRIRNLMEPIKFRITPDRLFVMSFDLTSFIGGKLPQQLESEIKQAKPIDKRSTRHASIREEVLLAAIYCKEKWPDACTFQGGDKSGKTNITAWAKLINDKSLLFWPDKEDLPRSNDEIIRQLSNALTLVDKTKE